MQLPNEIQLQYGVKTFNELIHKKTDDGKKQTKGMPTATKPILVDVSEDDCKRLCEESGFQYQKGYEGRIIERIVTTEAVDRDGDLIRYSGVDNKNYRTNPVVLYAHDGNGLPVGRSIKEWSDSSIKGWKSWDLYFDTELDTTGFGDIVFRFVKSGAMTGGSIGFLPLEARWDHTPKERNELGLGVYGVEYIKIEKLEHSACSVPANQEALARHLKSLDKEMLIKEFKKDDFDVMKKTKAIDENLIDIFYSVLFGKSITLPSIKMPVEPIEKESNTVNINFDISQISEEISGISKLIKDFHKDVESIQKTISDNATKIMARLEKMSLHTDFKSALYDRSDIEDALKIRINER